MKVSRSDTIPDVLIVEPILHRDGRGYFLELYNEARYLEIIPVRFVQDNLSLSLKGVLRGLHYQIGNPQGKLVSVIEGEIYDVAADIRRGSPTFGAHTGMILSAENQRQVYIPEGLAHGFFVIGERALILYKCTTLYDPAAERGIRWNDPLLSISWPVSAPLLSARDRELPAIETIPPNNLPMYGRSEIE